MVLMSSGESLCIMLLTRSVVLKRCFGVEVAADKRLIIVVFLLQERGFAASDCLPDRSDADLSYNCCAEVAAGA